MRNFREMLRILRAAQCRLSVAYHLQDLERAKEGLARSFAALDAAEAEVMIHDQAERSDNAPPIYLIRSK